MKPILRTLTIAFAASFFAAMPSHARLLNIDEAKTMALSQSTNTQLEADIAKGSIVHTITNINTGKPLMYVIDRGNNSGYVIVAADDRARNIIGYTDSGSWDENNIPQAQAAMLSYYQAEIANAPELDEQNIATKASDKKSIAPMIDTRWDQRAPYNDYTPFYNGANCPTGCVATAMAQVMKYHNYPETGKGSYSYKATVGNGTQNLSADFANTTYEWDKMTNTYNSFSSTESRNAVATLMSHCGIAVRTIYGNSSGAAADDVAMALVRFFKYDLSTRYLQRCRYSDAEWNDMVYQELAEGRPVLYSGQSSRIGHAFVCDGYDSSTGLFHINWGWSGTSDGYFALSALNPSSQGAGGAAGANYVMSQGAVFGARPNAGSTQPYNDIMLTGDLYCETGLELLRNDYTWGSAIFNAKANDMGYAGIQINSNEDWSLTAQIAFAVQNLSTKEIQYYDIKAKSTSQNQFDNYQAGAIYGMASAFRLSRTFLFKLPEGKHRLWVVWRQYASEDFRIISAPKTALRYIDLNVEADRIELSYPDMSDIDVACATPSASGKTSSGDLYWGMPLVFSGKITATGGDWISNVGVRVSTPDGKEVFTSTKQPFSVSNGETQPLNLDFMLPSGTQYTQGEYVVELVHGDSNTAIDGSRVTTKILASGTERKLVYKVWFDDNNQACVGTDPLHVSIKNEGSVAYIKIQPIVFGSENGALSNIGSLELAERVIEPGETINIDFKHYSGSELIDGKSYRMAFYDLSTDAVNIVSEAGFTNFIYSVNPAAVEGVGTDALTEVARYNALGQPISSPQKGINIVVYSNGTTRKELVK